MNGNLLKSRVSEICVKRIRVNQGVGVMSQLYAPHFPTFFANNLFGMTLQENGIQSNFRNREIVR